MGKTLKKVGNIVTWPLPQIIDALKPPDIGSPPPPPALPTILTDTATDTAEIEKKKRQKALGRRSTVATSGGLSDAPTYKPTLLGQ